MNDYPGYPDDHMRQYEELIAEWVTPRVGEEVGDVLEADIPGCYHLITSKIRDTGTTVFEFLPSWEMDDDGRLVPMSVEAAERAYEERRVVE
jgi:hypothetical protein